MMAMMATRTGTCTCTTVKKSSHHKQIFIALGPLHRGRQKEPPRGSAQLLYRRINALLAPVPGFRAQPLHSKPQTTARQQQVDAPVQILLRVQPMQELAIILSPPCGISEYIIRVLNGLKAYRGVRPIDPKAPWSCASAPRRWHPRPAPDHLDGHTKATRLGVSYTS